MKKVITSIILSFFLLTHASELFALALESSLKSLTEITTESQKYDQNNSESLLTQIMLGSRLLNPHSKKDALTNPIKHIIVDYRNPRPIFIERTFPGKKEQIKEKNVWARNCNSHYWNGYDSIINFYFI